MTAGTRAAALGRADALFIALACGVVPLVSLVIAVHAFAAIAHANLVAYVASIVKWATLGGGALVLGRRAGMSWDELYLDPRGSPSASHVTVKRCSTPKFTTAMKRTTTTQVDAGRRTRNEPLGSR